MANPGRRRARSGLWGSSLGCSPPNLDVVPELAAPEDRAAEEAQHEDESVRDPALELGLHLLSESGPAGSYVVVEEGDEAQREPDPGERGGDQVGEQSVEVHRNLPGVHPIRVLLLYRIAPHPSTSG